MLTRVTSTVLFGNEKKQRRNRNCIVKCCPERIDEVLGHISVYNIGYFFGNENVMYIYMAKDASTTCMVYG